MISYMTGICKKDDNIDVKRVIYHSKIVTKLGSIVELNEMWLAPCDPMTTMKIRLRFMVEAYFTKKRCEEACGDVGIVEGNVHYGISYLR